MLIAGRGKGRVGPLSAPGPALATPRAYLRPPFFFLDGGAFGTSKPTTLKMVSHGSNGILSSCSGRSTRK